MSDPDATSEVADLPPQQSSQSNAPSNAVMEQMMLFSTGMEAIFKKIAENMTSCQPVQHATTKLVNYDPDEPESDVVNWCTLSELIIEQKKIKGIDLILALTHSLKGRAATCLTNIKPDQISWPAIKEMLISRFAKPLMMQDHFDHIIKFQLDGKESPAEAGMRLWQLIEKIPEVNMPEKVITGFAISVLSQCDDKIRRELNSVVINDKSQLFRTLRGFTLKRRNEDIGSTDPDAKRFRNNIPFRGSCHFCGKHGHRGQDCRDKNRFIARNTSVAVKGEPPHSSALPRNPRPSVACYVCADPGHVASACPMRYKKKEDAAGTAASSSKQVNVCSRAAHGVIQISGIKLPFVFDSGSECSLIKQSYCKFLKGEQFHEQIALKGVGNNNVISMLQVKCPTIVQNLNFDITYHALPDEFLSEEVLLGRDVLELGISIQISDDHLTFIKKKISNSCALSHFHEDTIETDLVGNDRERLLHILKKYSNNFVQSLPTTRIKTGELKIDLIDPAKIVHRRPYSLSPLELDIVHEKIQKMLDANIIRESSSPFSSPILLVKKRDGSDRLCVDYRELNSNTRPDSYPLPLISDQINKLHGAYYYSIVDMASGFHQVRVHEDTVEKTAFVTPTGQYEFLTMPFGLRNAPQVFQRAINTALKPLKDDRILVYMDDVLAASVTVDEGLSRLDKLLETLSIAGFSFNFKKCSFMKKEIEYLGYVVSSGALKPNPRKVQALQNAPKPSTVKQVRQFIGLATYFRQFIPNFSKLLKPLYPLTSGKGRIIWTAEHDKIHSEIVRCLITEPVLKIFDPSLPIELHTDASSDGYGAVLIQKYDSLPHVVAYFSHKTTSAESRYHSYELETLAVVKSVEHFRRYLYGRHFTVFTDCNALKASHSKKRPYTQSP